jgi:4-hydroxybenzoate polyprenyltransferase
MILGYTGLDYPPHALAAHGQTTNIGMTIVLVVLIAALAVVYWRVTLRLIGIAILTLLISGSVMAYRQLHHGHGRPVVPAVRHVNPVSHVSHVHHVRHVRHA